jgi:hypothetical protein
VDLAVQLLPAQSCTRDCCRTDCTLSFPAVDEQWQQLAGSAYLNAAANCRRGRHAARLQAPPVTPQREEERMVATCTAGDGRPVVPVPADPSYVADRCARKLLLLNAECYAKLGRQHARFPEQHSIDPAHCRLCAACATPVGNCLTVSSSYWPGQAHNVTCYSSAVCGYQHLSTFQAQRARTTDKHLAAGTAAAGNGCPCSSCRQQQVTCTP